MIKKVTIILLIILILAVGGKLLFDHTLGGRKEVPVSDLWSYTAEDGIVTITAYNGSEAIPAIPETMDDMPVTALGDGIFAGNTKVKEVSIPASVTNMGTGIFENCTELSMVTLPESVTNIPAKTFSGCSSLKVIQLPYGIKSIGANAFSGCSNLSFLEIPGSVTSIGEEAFLNCSALSELTISVNLTNIGAHAFRGTPWLSAQSDEFVIIGNRILIKYNGIAEMVSVPYGVTQITDAFEDNMFPLEIELPDSLTSIGPYAFSGCRSLERINIPERVTSIGKSAFRGCGHLNSIELPDALRSIGASAFQSCSSLTRMVVPDGVKSLPSLAFANCEKLSTLQIPGSVESIADDIVSYSGISELRVFKGSYGEEFAIQKGIRYSYMQQSNDDFIYQQTENGVQVVLYTGSIYDVVIPETLSGDPVTSISDILFQHNYLVRSVELPRTITRIADYCFSDMGELRTVRLPNTLKSIGMGAFMNDPLLGEMEIPSSVEDIAEDAFFGCPSLVILAEEGSYAYNWAVSAGIRVRDNKAVNTELFRFVKPAGLVLVSAYTGVSAFPDLPRTNDYGEFVSGVADEAFRGLEISSISIPSGYQVIGDLSFADDPVPLEITIPRSVISISDDCFEGTEVTICGYNGSYAEDYARSHKIKFLVIFEWEL